MPQNMSIGSLQPTQPHIRYQSIFICTTLCDKHSISCPPAVLPPHAIYWIDHVVRMNQNEADSYVKDSHVHLIAEKGTEEVKQVENFQKRICLPG